MFGIGTRLPIGEEDRQWVESGFEHLSTVLGRKRMLGARVILPDAEHFPDPYDKSDAAIERMFCRICEYMQVDRESIDLEIFPDETSELSSLLPYWSGSQSGCAGLYVHPGDEDKRVVVALRQSKIDDPLAVVATLAHELGHVILLGGELVDRKTTDMEPLTDLLTVFLGLGIFTANCSARFSQWHKDGRYGWSMQRLGYLPEQVYGYALARFAHDRGDDRPRWAAHLSTNVRSYFKKSAEWIEKQEKAASKPIG